MTQEEINALLAPYREAHPTVRVWYIVAGWVFIERSIAEFYAYIFGAEIIEVYEQD